MLSPYERLKIELLSTPRTWLVTGAAGFIGSHLVEALLSLDQTVIGLDNFVTGRRQNLDYISSEMPTDQWARFRFYEGDITSLDDCRRAVKGVSIVLHQAALGSVPRSITDPLRSHATNVNGFINMLIAARDERVSRLVYASSSSVYGNHPALPKVEENIGKPLSPYAATKYINEVYAAVFSRCYNLSAVGLRYFNVFGPRQDPNGAYAAVIPRWYAAAIAHKPIIIFGDGETSRDFCYVSNVVQANLLAATAPNECVTNRVFNIAAGQRTTLKELAQKILDRVARQDRSTGISEIQFQEERRGDVRHSLAQITAAEQGLSYTCTHDVDRGLDEACEWYLRNHKADSDDVAGGERQREQ